METNNVNHGGQVKLSLLQIVSEARNSHGLRLQDPVRYSTYCAKKILSLKKSLKFVQKSKKAPPKPVTKELVLQDQRYLEVVLFSAERAWSQSASLKSDDAHPPKRHHVARRLTKAQRLAELLSSLVESCNADSETRLQARAYKASIAGQAAFEKKQWQNALREYCVVKVILDVLISKADETTQPVYKEGISSVDPSLRYSAYQSQVGSTGDMLSFAYNYVSKDTSLMGLLNDVNPAIVEERQKGPTRAGITSIQWRSRTASLDFPEIAVSLLKVQDAQAAFTERTSTFDLAPHEKASAMDDVLNAWAEAEESVAKIIEEGAGRSQDKEQNLQIIRTYVGFHTISARVQRDLLLIKDLEKRQGNQITILKDLVRLHDSIIQSIQQIYDFPGIPADAQLVDDLESRQNYFKASRCILLARSHRLRKDYISTLALQERAETYLKNVSVSPTSVTHSDIPITKEDVDTLAVTLSSEITRAYTHVVLSQSNSKSSAASKKPLLVQLSQFPEPGSIDLTNLVEPPKLQPVPVKPYFFDIAYNYIGLEEQAPKPVQPGKQPESEQPKRGWFWR